MVFDQQISCALDRQQYTIVITVVQRSVGTKLLDMNSDHYNIGLSNLVLTKITAFRFFLHCKFQKKIELKLKLNFLLQICTNKSESHLAV